MERVRTGTFPLVLAGALACACGGDPPGGASGPPPGSDSVPPPAVGPPPAGAPAPDAAEDSTGAAGAWVETPVASRRPDAAVATLVAVRTATHPGYDRIVFDFGADPVPSYRIETLRGTAAQCGSGQQVDAAGGAQLEIALEPARAHTEEGEVTVTGRDLRIGLPAIARLVLTCDFEAHVDWVASLTAPARVRVRELSGPYRLVIDVAHPGNGPSSTASLTSRAGAVILSAPRLVHSRKLPLGPTLLDTLDCVRVSWPALSPAAGRRAEA